MMGLQVSGGHAPVWRLTAALAMAGAVAMLGGCSAFSDPSYPAIHDMPAARPETPMSQDEVKRATADLVSERNTLNAEAQPAADATGSMPPAAGKDAKPAPAAAAKPQTSGARPNP